MDELELGKREERVVDAVEHLRADIEMIQQPRSDFALEHFVIATQDMPARQRAQAILELQIKMFAIRRIWLDVREKELDRKELQEKIDSIKGGDERALIKIQRIDTDLAELQLVRLGAVREAECLLEILDHLPHYTRDQFEKEEAAYWIRRLARQAIQDLMSMGNVSAGNREAIRQLTTNAGEKTEIAMSIQELQALANLPSTIKEIGLPSQP